MSRKLHSQFRFLLQGRPHPPRKSPYRHSRSPIRHLRSPPLHSRCPVVIHATPCRHSRAHHHVIHTAITSFPRRRESGCAVLRRPLTWARSYDVPPDVRERRRVDPAAMRRPPARKSMRRRPPDIPGPPALGSSSGGTGVGVAVDVDVGTGVRVGVIVGGGVGVLVATMSYEPAAGGLVARGVGV